MSGIATAVVAGSVISSVAANKASKRAAKAQERGINTATGENKRQFDITTGRLEDAEATNRLEVERARNSAINTLARGEARQREQLDPFAQAGRDALGQQQALLGMGGQEAQDAAFNAFSESPGQRFIRERAQKSLTRNAAALGGIGGGNVRSALVEQGAGFAAQDFGNQFNRLSDLRTSGQAAATNIGQGALTSSSNIASTRFNAGQLLGSAALNSAAREGQFGQNFATNQGNLAIQSGNARASSIQNQSNINQNMFGQIAGAAGQFFGQ